MRSKVKVPQRSLWYSKHRPMLMHPHTKYNWPIWKDKKSYGLDKLRWEEAEEAEEKIRLKQYVSLRSKGRHNYGTVIEMKVLIVAKNRKRKTHMPSFSSFLDEVWQIFFQHVLLEKRKCDDQSKPFISWNMNLSNFSLIFIFRIYFTTLISFF